ncbi:extensin family protein [Bauldia sp.]|uniref:extensin-like domain-containing protein n=1 Tax=Bauldia sp. TaxID=2575872 RepID=UPI003BA8AAE2
MNRVTTATVTVALIVSGVSIAEVWADDSLRRLFAPPVQTLKEVFTRDRAKPSSRRLTPTSEVEPPATPTSTIVVPLPRLRPMAVAAAETSTIAAPSPQVPAAEFDRRFSDAAPGPLVTTFEPLPPPPAGALQATNPAEPEVTVVAPEPPAPAASEAGTPAVIAAPLVEAAPTSPATVEAQAFVAVPLPRPRSAAAAALSRRDFTAPPEGAADGCGGRLAAIGIVAEKAPPIRDGRCGIAEPTRVSALGAGGIKLSRPSVLNCQVAEALAGLIAGPGNLAARQHLGGRITGIRVAAAYHCRTRNGQPGAKLSEHSFGNAVDISAFQVDGVGWVEVGRGPLRERRFLSAVRKAACGPFTTVLGPGSDRFHDSHFHFDLAKRGKTGRSLYCK